MLAKHLATDRDDPLTATMGMDRVAVHLTRPRPHFGGARWWIVCATCYRRTSVLYGPPFSVRCYFACHRCHPLTYHARSLATADRWVRRGERLQARVAWRGVYTHDDGLYYKPKRMDWRTFRATFDAFEGWQNAAIVFSLAKLWARIGDAQSRQLVAEARAEGMR